MLPEAIQNLINSLERLPGIGPKTASRLAFLPVESPGGYLHLAGGGTDLP